MKLFLVLVMSATALLSIDPVKPVVAEKAAPVVKTDVVKKKAVKPAKKGKAAPKATAPKVATLAGEVKK